MSALLSARRRAADTSLHPIQAGAVQLAHARHGAALVMIGAAAVMMVGALLGLAVALGGLL
ncbi:hypothetical protein [Aquabacter cavernae]|uniref:hypothetical protein n=1 Tax=Aquabacter cavernae TaxID=2496029 RepID=UPI000F8F6CE6|nr:hypothetical protein [Aquabacter cavernae]